MNKRLMVMKPPHWTLTKANKETKMNRDRDSDCVRDGDRKQFNIG